MRPLKFYSNMNPGIGILFFLIVLSFTGQAQMTLPSVIQLKGEWQFKIESPTAGTVNPANLLFNDHVQLPGTMDENEKGVLNTSVTTSHLSRVYYFVGPAWYQKEIEIPVNWKGKHIELHLERTKVTKVWVDDVLIGTDNKLFSMQVFDLTNALKPGKHRLTILVNNDERLVPIKGTHAYSEDTQTNWNGIIGKMELVATDNLRIDGIKLVPDIKYKRINALVHILKANAGNGANKSETVSISISAIAFNSKVPHKVATKTFTLTLSSSDTIAELTYPMGAATQLWSEFQPSLYSVVIELKNGGKTIDKKTSTIGMRSFKTQGTHFTINDKTVFLRGKHDGCVFPLTGYPPMDKEGWIRVFRIAKTYGINAYRFHTWCPPEAAFEAADICGIYLQPELAIWGSFKAEDPEQVSYMMREGKAILDSYANHPSFVMFSLGNEMGQDRKVLTKMVADLRKHDNRPLYATGSNNRYWDPTYAEGDDYWTSFRTGKEKKDLSSDVRSSISYPDENNRGGLINAYYPSSTFTYDKAIQVSPVPVIGHEIGEYQVYPDYAEIKKYTGILRARNFEVFRSKLEEKGMLNEALRFHEASGQLTVLCYRADIETALRTAGFGGFHLLDLQDYPGQGSALVGILDAFMDSKGLITPEKFREFCNDVVLLFKTDKFCWQNNEILSGEIEIANYGASAFANKNFSWQLISDVDKKIVQSGNISALSLPQGKLSDIGQVQIDLKKIAKAEKVTLQIAMQGSSYKTEYAFWVYPAEQNITVPNDIAISSSLSQEILTRLAEGGKVLLFPDTTKLDKRTVPGAFITDFWNYGMFSSFAKAKAAIPPGTMGLLMDPKHPLFTDFPTDFHSNWQWWSITKNSTPLILDNTDKAYRPIIQVIDNINRNHKLGLVFEFAIGKGKLLVCMSDLRKITDKPEAKQLYASILKYMESNQFNPSDTISITDIQKLVQP